MNRTDALYQSFLDILREELVPAMCCTEPIAIAYAAAQARAVLGKRPERVRIEVSGNIIKNVKSVIVPHTGSMHGIAAAAAAGIIAGREDRELEVLSEVTQAQIEEMRAYLKEAAFEIRPIDSPFIFDIRITVCVDGDQATARIVGSHTNLVQLLHGTTRIIDRPCSETVSERRTDRSILTVERIVDFADSLCPEDVQELFERQISYNMAIAEAGLSGSYGANVGRTLREAYGETVNNRARYMAAAASDARMSGCELPVIINSGSGNQGITASVPVVVYAQELGVSRETLYRALAVSNLSTIHIKRISGRCPPTAEPSRQAAARERALHIFMAADMSISSTRSSTPWRSRPASSATGPSPPVRPRSRPAWTRDCSAIICTAAATSSTPGTASSNPASSTRLKPSARWPTPAWPTPTARSSA